MYNMVLEIFRAPGSVFQYRITSMIKLKPIILFTGMVLFLFSCRNSANSGHIKIGTQIWASKNLDVTLFRNGESIQEAKTNEEWLNAGNEGKPAWCYYGNNPGNNKKYGKLYNWFAVNDTRGLAPAGWHVPGDEEWTILIGFLGGENNAAIEMKSKTGWEYAGNGTNMSGFSAIPGGYRNFNGAFGYFITNGYWWSSSKADDNNAWFRNLYYFNNIVTRDRDRKSVGFSVRCVMD
jgi:uncharacterized protein (TIGR02145 family)